VRARWADERKSSGATQRWLRSSAMGLLGLEVTRGL
jgi:hypothetical protein